MFKTVAIKNDVEQVSYHALEHDAKHSAIDLAYEGFKTYVYFGDKHLGYSKVWRSEQFGNCFGVVPC